MQALVYRQPARWELALLEDLGFGLDLDRCAVTGRSDGLAFVSPRTGRAVSAGSATEWEDRLLPLPACLSGVWDGDLAEIAEAMRTTGYFLTNWLAHSLGDHPVPQARARLSDLLGRQPREA